MPPSSSAVTPERRSGRPVGDRTTTCKPPDSQTAESARAAASKARHGSGREGAERAGSRDGGIPALQPPLHRRRAAKTCARVGSPCGRRKVSLTALRPLLLSAQSAEQAVRRKLRAGLGLRGSPAAGRRPILGHGRVGRQGGCSAPPSKLANSVRALPSAPLPVPHTGRCTAPLATSSPEGSAQA